ncbi:MAG: DUF1990 domain-containing protein [bacterium]|nr:DUF1990 domain-containing protein [bacterium]
MILLRKPEPFAIRSFLDEQLGADFNYPEVGSSRIGLPRGYDHNRTVKQVGNGESAFLHACRALQSWQQLQLGWVYSWPLNAPLRPGESIAVIGRSLGLWWLNACRVVYVENDLEGEHHRVFGYAVGTLQQHLLRGEERYTVELRPDESVWVEIAAFSKPNSGLAAIGYPLIRRAQERFGKFSSQRLAECMQASIRADGADEQSNRPRESLAVKA